MRPWRRIFVSCSSLLLVAACGARAETEAMATLSAHDAWARPADSGATTAVYFVLRNTSAVPDTIVGVASAEAGTSSMHMSLERERMMHMVPMRSLRVPANDSVAFRPLGAHVMLTGLRRPLAVGDTIVALLTFESGQTLEVRAGVRQP